MLEDLYVDVDLSDKYFFYLWELRKKYRDITKIKVIVVTVEKGVFGRDFYISFSVMLVDTAA